MGVKFVPSHRTDGRITKESIYSLRAQQRVALIINIITIILLPKLGGRTEMENGRTRELPGQDGVMLVYLQSVWDRSLSHGEWA